jgi:hypothetical protein
MSSGEREGVGIGTGVGTGRTGTTSVVAGFDVVLLALSCPIGLRIRREI